MTGYDGKHFYTGTDINWDFGLLSLVPEDKRKELLNCLQEEMKVKMIEQEKSSNVAFWCNHITKYEKDTQSWYARSKKIIKRYKDDRSDTSKASANKFNILWSNVQTLAPALYDRAPNPNIDRRFQSDDKLGTVSAQVLERAASFLSILVNLTM